MSNRSYIIFEDVLQDKELKDYLDKCIEAIQTGKARVSKTKAKQGYPSYPCFNIEGKAILVEAALEYFLYDLQTLGFVSKKAEEFTDKMRVLCGWQWEVDRTLKTWIEKIIRNRFFYDAGESKYEHKWILKTEEMEYPLPEEYLKFACFVAVCFTRYGHSEDKSFSEEILSFVSALGSSLPAEIKKRGSGLIPIEILECKTKEYSCVANDVFATIKITVKKQGEESYAGILDYLCRLLEFGFAKSYAIEFRGPNKTYLPIKKLPKKGVNQLFANAVEYPSLQDKIEKYARLAMKEFEWYHNLEGEFCAMPGSFAVFALGLRDEKYHPLVCDYLLLCDGEHQSIQGEFVLAYIEKNGFTEKGQELYRLCEENMEHLPAKLIALYKKIKK